jgi:uncharacterized protein YecT (DUF1311 family)
MTVTAFITIAALIAQNGAVPSAGWTLSYEGKSTNELRWDKRIESLVNTRVPAGLSRDLLEALGGPPEPVLVADHRYVSMSACVAHACFMKGFFWVDTRTGVGLGALFGARFEAPRALQLGSNGMSHTQIPTAARGALIDWLTENELTPDKVEFIGSRGDSSPLAAQEFQPRARYKPAVGGPSFDCSRASGVVEQAICSDRALSALDLSLFTLADSIRRGHSTTNARNQLLDMQHAWLEQRDVECGVAVDIKACLEKKYREQSDKLWHWLPKR